MVTFHTSSDFELTGLQLALFTEEQNAPKGILLFVKMQVLIIEGADNGACTYVQGTQEGGQLYTVMSRSPHFQSHFSSAHPPHTQTFLISQDSQITVLYFIHH